MAHLDAIDATFLELEEADEAAHMHIGAVLEFEPRPDGTTPTLEELRELLDERVDLLPRYRQRLSRQHTGGLDWPAWETDEGFGIARHVRRATLPAPGGEAELTEWAADFWSHRMDRSIPLWEIVLVDGLAGGGWALVTKTHHCMVDGVGSVDIAHVLLDVDPAGRRTGDIDPPDEPPGRSAVPGWLSGPPRLAGRALRDAAQAARHPRTAARRTQQVADLLVQGELRQAPATSLNAPITGRRRFAAVDAPLDAVRSVARASEAKVNDVVLAAVAGALRRLLIARGEEPPAAGLRAMVPVNVREAAEHDGRLGNRISSMFIDLPVADATPEERLRRAREESRRHKRGDQAAGAAALLELTSLAPPVLHHAIARSLYATRLFNITVTNVPGPQLPLYSFGARMKRVMPLVPLASDHAVGVAIVSYDGTLTFGVVADFDAMPDLDVLRGALADELEALRGAAVGATVAAG